MEEEIIPFQVKMGMGHPRQLRGRGGPERVRVDPPFREEGERKRLYDAVYQSDYWKNEIGPKVGGLIDREQIKVQRIVATPHSVIQ